MFITNEEEDKVSDKRDLDSTFSSSRSDQDDLLKEFDLLGKTIE